MRQPSMPRQPRSARAASRLAAHRPAAHRLAAHRLAAPLLAAPLLIAALLAAQAPAAHADTASITATPTYGTQWLTSGALSNGVQFNTFTNTLNSADVYIAGSFSVGSGTYSAGVNYGGGGGGNVIYLLNSALVPSTVSADLLAQAGKFIVGKYSNTSGASVSGVNLAAGQYYYLVILGGTVPVQLTVSGTGCVSFSTSCTLTVLGASRLDNPASLSSNALGSAAWGGQLGGFDRVSGRLEALRFSAGSSDTAPVAYSLDGPMTGLAAGDVAPKHGLWTRAIGGDQSQSTSQNGAGYKGRAWGLAAGYDRAITAATTIGAAVAYTSTNYSFQDQGADQGARVKDYQLTAYASHDYKVAYVDAMLGYSKQRYDTSRGYGANTGSYGGELYSARLGGGVPFAITPRTTLVPQLRLDYGRMQQDAYTESGAAALTVAPRHAERLRSSLGAQLNYNMQIGKLKVQPYARAFWNHEFKNNGLVSSANLNGTDLTISGQALPRETYTAGIGATMLVNASFSALLGYDYDFGGGYKANTVKATGRWVF